MNEKRQVRQEREAKERDAAIERLKTATATNRETVHVATADVKALLGYAKEIESWLETRFVEGCRSDSP